MCPTSNRISNFLRALRLSFVPASILPFILGSLMAKENFNFPDFTLGLCAVICVHLSANLINDWADSKSGLDWQDKRFYKFFGGSKLIQEGVFSERSYFQWAASFMLCSACLIIILALRLKNISILVFYSLIIILAWSYSAKPIQLAYKKTGEIAIFVLFGPALVMGGYFIQTQVFLHAGSLIVSLPVGFLITAVLFCNEIPDYGEDKACGKSTWVSFSGKERAYLIYIFLTAGAFASIALAIARGYLNKTAFFSFLFIFPAVKAALALKNADSKESYKLPSRLTILTHTLVTAALILSVF